MIPVQTPEIDIDQLVDAVGDASVVDGRKPGKCVARHMRGAVLIPMGQLPGGRHA